MALPVQRVLSFTLWNNLRLFSSHLSNRYILSLSQTTYSPSYRTLVSCSCNNTFTSKHIELLSAEYIRLFRPKLTLSLSRTTTTSSSTLDSESHTAFSGVIPIEKLKISYSRSSGPGGQHVNTTNSKVEVRFSVKDADWIPEEAKLKILEHEQARITKGGELVVTSDKTRKQLLNQAECLNKIRNIVFAAARPPPQTAPEKKQRHAALQAKANRERLKVKSHKSMIKRARQGAF